MITLIVIIILQRPRENDINIVEDIKDCGLFDDIMLCVYRLEHSGNSLINNITNNNAELYNSVLCKFVDGKRINFSQKRFYKMRCLQLLFRIIGNQIFIWILKKFIYKYKKPTSYKTAGNNKRTIYKSYLETREIFTDHCIQFRKNK